MLKTVFVGFAVVVTFLVIMICASVMANKLLMIEGIAGAGLSFILVFVLVGTAIFAAQSLLDL